LPWDGSRGAALVRLFELAEIAAAHLGFIGKIVLRKPLFIAQAAKVGG
jgi:hypothetical protein